uniref:Uncharacterized protein n=1 Tax=Gorilla gorilla gorilla TaxID=9595 RepID=G3RN57_GORGO
MELESTIFRDEDKLFIWGRLWGELSSKQPPRAQGRGLPGWLGHFWFPCPWFCIIHTNHSMLLCSFTRRLWAQKGQGSPHSPVSPASPSSAQGTRQGLRVLG